MKHANSARFTALTQAERTHLPEIHYFLAYLIDVHLSRLGMLSALGSSMMQTQHKCSGHIDLPELLSRDYQRLEKVFEDITVAFRANAHEEVHRLWREFDNGLRAHLDLEENFILPEFSKFDPVSAQELAREHIQIRTTLNEFAISLEHNFSRCEAVFNFVELLKTHAKREDALMYQWAQGNLREQAKSTIRNRVLLALSKLISKPSLN